MRKGINVIRTTLLAPLPMLLALVGAFMDERHHTGISNWSSACRASGLSLRSVGVFTVELLPTAIVGGLLGALLVLMPGILARRRRGLAHASLATHAGCMVAMPAGLLLCASGLSLAPMLAAETLLVVVFAWCIGVCSRRACTGAVAPSVVLPTRAFPRE